MKGLRTLVLTSFFAIASCSAESDQPTQDPCNDGRVLVEYDQGKACFSSCDDVPGVPEGYSLQLIGSQTYGCFPPGEALPDVFSSEDTYPDSSSPPDAGNDFSPQDTYMEEKGELGDLCSPASDCLPDYFCVTMGGGSEKEVCATACDNNLDCPDYEPFTCTPAQSSEPVSSIKFCINLEAYWAE